MKFKLSKSDHLHKFQLFNKIEKLKLTTRENKVINGDSLVFKSIEEKLYIYISNEISSSYIYLCDVNDDFVDFAIDSNLFTNAFSNFPTDEIQFSFIQEDNMLVFGNKKTRVSLKTSPVTNIDDKFNSDFLLNETNINKISLDSRNLSSAIKYTSFSCAPDFDEYPYTSIMFFIEKNRFHAQSSDKHRISIYGDNFKNQQSYLISKNQAELALSFIPKEKAEYVIHKNKFVIYWADGGFSTSLEANTHQSIYNSFSEFFSESQLISSISIDKNAFTKSLKFISSVSSSNNFYINGAKNEVILSSSKNDQGAVVDRINIDEEIESIEASYLFNHFMKVLDIVQNEQVNIDFMDYNGYTICVIHDSNYNHLIFPVE